MKYKGVALSGKMRTGKNTTANMIQSKDGRYAPYAFADRLKELARELTGLDFYDEEVKTEYRDFLISLGTTMRVYDPLYWVRLCLQRIQEDYSLNPNIVPVITDLRYKNEAYSLQKKGFMLVRLRASDVEIANRGGELLEDASETDLDDWGDWDLIVDTGENPPASVANVVYQVFKKSNQNDILASELMGLSPEDFNEVIEKLRMEGKLTL